MKIRAKDGGWNPYFAGALAGLLAVASAFATRQLLGSTSFLGASTTFVRFAALAGERLSPGYSSSRQYLVETGTGVGWQFMLVLGILLGALISSVTDKSFKLEAVPPIWKKRFGASWSKRALGAFAGGIIAMFGARLADGCPSGHGMSGMMQLSISGIISLALFFATGIFVATLIYERSAR